MASAADADPLPSSPSPRATRQAWSYVVRGDPEAPTSPSSSPPPVGFSDHPDRSPQKTPPPPEDVAAASSSSSDAARAKRPAWKRPPNGSVEAGAAVMGGAASWPALSESTKFAPKSPSLDALNDLSDGPLPVALGVVVSNSPPKPNLSPSTTSDHAAPVRQKSMRRGGGTSGSSGNGAPSDNGMVHSSPSPTPQSNSEKQTLPELPPRNQPTTNTANWDHGSRGGGSGSQANDGVNHNRGYGGTRRWNTVGGSGSHQNNYGNRNDAYRRNAGGRDFHMQQRNPRPYYRLPVAPPFLSPPPQVRPFGNPPMVFSDVPSPVLYVSPQPPPVGVPFVPHPAVPPALFIPALDPQRASLLHQIDYYFSPENLCKDVYLRQNMDEQGWVPLSLIAGFNRVRQLTNNIDFILDAVRMSNVVEVQGDKIRKRNEWINWVLPASNNQFVNTSTLSTATPNSDNLAARLQSVGLNGVAERSSTVVPSLSEQGWEASAVPLVHPFSSLLLVLPENVQSLSLSSKKTAPKVPAVLLFGDSIVDTGNNNELLTTTRCDFPPYGKDFPGHMATGRFSNGRNPSDILASQLGIKEFVPPYLGTELDAEELLTGVCFASGGCGYDPQTSKITSALSLGDQLDMFREYKEKLKRTAGEGRAEQIIANSLYVVVSGSNDIVTTYFLFPFRRKEFDIPSYIKFLVQSSSSFLQELYQSGARKIAVMGVPPLVCVSSQRTLAGGKGRDCVAQYNDVSRLFNSELSKEMQRLNNILPLSTIPYIDMYTPVLDMILHPSAYGFKEVTRGCCGTGYIEVTLSCNSYTSLACGNASEYVFWDSFHPTERTAEIFITKFLQQYGHLLVD